MTDEAVAQMTQFNSHHRSVFFSLASLRALFALNPTSEKRKVLSALLMKIKLGLRKCHDQCWEEGLRHWRCDSRHTALLQNKIQHLNSYRIDCDEICFRHSCSGLIIIWINLWHVSTTLVYSCKTISLSCTLHLDLKSKCQYVNTANWDGEHACYTLYVSVF